LTTYMGCAGRFSISSSCMSRKLESHPPVHSSCVGLRPFRPPTGNCCGGRDG
jgi:hypothetical protein